MKCNKAMVELNWSYNLKYHSDFGTRSHPAWGGDQGAVAERNKRKTIKFK